MVTNVLRAIANLAEDPITRLQDHYRSNTRANAMGDSLEAYVKDLFANTLREDNAETKNTIYSQHFSYIGNQNNPPDFIIKNGDAVEVKKIQTYGSSLALNSSYPKDKLHSSSNMITDSCRSCENWTEKDLIYAIGTVIGGELRSLWFIHGECYAADKSIYESKKEAISQGINELPDIEFSETNELARVNRVDPLGITYFRIRGMWGIENPATVYRYLLPSTNNVHLSVNAIMLKDKYRCSPDTDKSRIERLSSRGLTIQDVKIKSPNNPANLLDAKFISFRV